MFRISESPFTKYSFKLSLSFSQSSYRTDTSLKCSLYLGDCHLNKLENRAFFETFSVCSIRAFKPADAEMYRATIKLRYIFTRRPLFDVNQISPLFDVNQISLWIPMVWMASQPSEVLRENGHHIDAGGCLFAILCGREGSSQSSGNVVTPNFASIFKPNLLTTAQLLVRFRLCTRRRYRCHR